MKVFINNPGENWIVDRIRQEWYDQKSDISTENAQEADLIWILAPEIDFILHLHQNLFKIIREHGLKTLGGLTINCFKFIKTFFYITHYDIV